MSDMKMQSSTLVEARLSGATSPNFTVLRFDRRLVTQLATACRAFATKLDADAVAFAAWGGGPTHSTREHAEAFRAMADELDGAGV